MPLTLAPKTKMIDVVLAAKRESRDHAGERLCLRLEQPGQLAFHAPTGAPVVEGAGVKDALVKVIADELGQGPIGWSSKRLEERTVWAQAIMESVLVDHGVYTEVSKHEQLNELMTRTQAMLYANDAARVRTDLQNQWVGAIGNLAMNKLNPAWQAAGNDAAAACNDLAGLKPQMEALQLLMHDAKLASAGGKIDFNSPDVRPQWALETLMLTARRGMANQSDVADAKKELNDTVAVQYAFMELWCNRLEFSPPPEKGQAPKNVLVVDDHETEIAVAMMADISQAAFEPIFLPREALARLEHQLDQMTGKDKQAFRKKVSVLRRNTKRYEDFRKSAVGSIPMTGVSREFQVLMFERLEGRFDADLVTNRAALIKHAGRPRAGQEAAQAAVAGLLRRSPSTVQRQGEPSIQQMGTYGGGTQALAWELQTLLCQLTDLDAPDQHQQWHEAAHLLSGCGQGHARDMFAYQDTIDDLETVVRIRGGGEVSPHEANMLGVLKNNARRMEAFMASGLSHNPNFENVDRAILIPWWEVMKDALPKAAVTHDEKEPPNLSPASSLDAAPDPDADPGPATLTVHLPPEALQDATGIAQTPDAREPSAGPVASTNEPAPTDGKSSPVMPPRTLAPAAALRPSPRPAAAVAGPVLASVAVPAAASVLTRPNQLLSSANPNRGGVKTGKELRNFMSRTGHHNRSRFKWLSKAERNGLVEQAKDRAAQAHLPRQARTTDRKE